MWHNFNYKKNSLVNSNNFKVAFDTFWDSIVNKIDSDNFVLVQLKVLMENNSYRSISYVQTLNKNNKQMAYAIFQEFWDVSSEEYHKAVVDEIIYFYKIVTGKSIVKHPKFNLHIKNIKRINKFKFRGRNLINNMDIFTWGNVKSINKDFTNVIISKINSPAEYHIKLYSKYYLVDYKINNITLFKFKDQLLDSKLENCLYTFVRTLYDQEYYFKDGKLIWKSIARTCKFIEPKKSRVYFRNRNFLTVDLETRTINGKMQPVCVSIFDGKVAKSFYLLDYHNEHDMLKASIEYLMIRKYSGYKVYLHNFSYFDGVFLLRVLSYLSHKIQPVIRDNRIVDLRFSYNIKNDKKTFYFLFFRDSYLLLPSSLRDLAKSFNVEDKSIFPYDFINNPEITLNYVGDVPNFKFFNNINDKEYYSYVSSFSSRNKKWNLREELIKYCEQDVIALYQVIDKFSKDIYDMFNLNITDNPTLPSLAFLIYRNKFMPKNINIPIILGDTYLDIKDGYTGGSVDVYKPFGKNIFHYDVNSLYPFVMRNFPMPVGIPKYFEGDIFNGIDFTSERDKPFGVFDVEVISPDNLNIPILQTKIQTEFGGIRTVSPLGKWEGTYFSEEIYNAIPPLPYLTLYGTVSGRDGKG